MSWEDFKKEKQQNSSWEEFKQNREKLVQVSNNKTPTNSISQNIKNFTSDTGRTFSNLGIGSKIGVKQSLNFAYKVGENRNKTEQQVKNERVLGSRELTNTEKALYIAQQQSKSVDPKNLNNEASKNVILPMLNNNTPRYNNTKVEEVANSNILDRSINKDQLKIQENIENQTNNFSKKLAELAPSIGNMGVGTAISALNPVAGMSYFTTSAGGSYMQDALDRGMTREQATTYGAIMGLMEGATEAIGVENLSKAGKGLKALVSGAGITATKEGAEQIAKNSIKTVLKDYGIGIADNVMQEAIIEPIQEVVAGSIGGKDKANWNDMGQRMLKAGIDGGLTSAILGGADLGIQSCVGVIEKTTNGQSVTQQEIQTAVKEASTQLDVTKMIEDSTQQEINKYNTLSGQSQLTQNQQNENIRQITPIMQKNAQNGILEQNNSILNNKDVPMLNYQYEKSDNTKINNLRQDAGKYFNNSEQARNYVSMLEQIITDKNVDIRLDSDLRTPDGQVANGSYSNGVITINPNSTKSGEFIAVHELTHAIGTDSMKNIIETYRKSNAEFNTAVENLLQNYNSTELTDEALSDVSAQLFGNQEFIANVSQNNHNIFKRIYNEIKYLWHQFRGYKNQNQFIDDLYYKWTQAYNSNNKLNETSNYSIAGKQGMINAIKTDTGNLELERNYNKAQQMQENGIDNETIRQSTGWFQDRNGDWKFEFSDRDMSLKNIRFKENSTYKLGDILEHDTLFTIYPELANYNVKFTDLNKANGVYNIFDKDIKINNNLLSKKQYKSSIEGTLIHEIQHAIQDIENFEGGRSSKESKLAYYESLGEIEASDTKARFLQERHKNIDLTDIAPESSKTNPKHQNLDKYLKNRKLLDKAKDGVYNYIKKRNGGNNEFSKENISKNKKQNMGLVDGRRRGRYVDEYEIENITNAGKNNEKNTLENNREDRGIYRDRINNSVQESENNSDSFSLQDNYGRKLSKEQQEYFKDSKVRDENGNLITVYHGTPYEFNQFKYDKLGENTSSLGAGFYFTDKQSTAEEYKHTGGNVKEVYLDIKNPISYGKTTITKKEFSKFVNAVNKKTNGILAEDYGNIQYAIDEYDYGGDDIDLVSSIKSASGLSWEELYKTLRNSIGKDGIISNEGFLNNGEKIYVAFNSNQIKNVENTNPTDNPDIRYSQDNGTWQQYLNKNFKTTGTRTNLQDIKNLAPIEKNVNDNKGIKAPIMQKQQNGSINAPISKEVKARKHYKSIMESQYTSSEAKTIAKELMGTDTYVPDSNNSQLERANERILNSTPESELNSFMSKAINGEKITATDIAVGEKLIQYYSKTGDKTKLQDAIQATAMAGTSAGQTVQALSLLNHQTPEGQAIWLQRSVDKMNNDLKKTRGKNAEQFNLTEDMIDKIVNSKDNDDLQNNLNDVYKQLGQQVSKTNLQKIDAWRYFSMLANPKTHIRNIVGNTAMAGVQGVKNKVAGAIEGTISKVNPNMERNHTIVSANKKVTTFAKNDIKNVADRLGLNENKYNPKTRLENSMRTFKSDTLENTIGKLFGLNDNLLEAEDGWGLKAGYTKALSEYMTANNLNPNTITDKQLAKARNYAVEQAQEATFHQASAIASSLNQFQNKNGLTKFIIGSTLPFKKTPINVAKAGLEYSPVGLTKSLIYDTVKLRKGNITVNKYIDNISKGLTGTGIALLGYALADAGILKASGSDDTDKEKYDEEMGKQTYSITIAGNTYSLDWLAPTGIPLFIGAECHELMQTEKEEKTSSSDENSKYSKALKSATNILDSFTNAMNPMTEMSMLSGLTSALKSYEQGSSQMIASLGTNAVKSYVNQFVPTALGQIARTTDKYERDTTSTKTGVLPKAIDSTKNQIINKTPALRQILPIKTDIWGNEVKQSDNIIQRELENAVLPWTRKEVDTTKVDNALMELYDETGESSILPDTLDKKLTINGQNYRLTNEEYSKYKTAYGKTSYNLLNSLVSSSEYKSMSNSQKQTAIESIYDYAKEKNKVDYAQSVNETIKTSTNYNILEELRKAGESQTQYLSYSSETKEIQGEKANQKKNKLLLDANYSSKAKSIIYQNTTGKNDDTYRILNKLDSSKNIINQYLDYLQADLKADREDDSTENGKAISGSKKQKVYNYINSIDSKDMSYVQRLYLTGVNTTLSTSDKKKIFTLINENKSLTKNEKLEALDKLQGFTVYKDGKVAW